MPRVRFLAHGKEWEVDAPLGASLRDASKLIDAPEGDACGGVCACSTCHVYVLEGRALLSPAEEEEEDILDKAFDVRATSRLGCQAKLVGDGVVVCDITRESLDAYYNEHPQTKDPRKAR
ncbi:MAG TPA: 2Fe-2S iron-sulfur cluster-binding protein [Byssovorax sp.]|jgi:ferredoxin